MKLSGDPWFDNVIQFIAGQHRGNIPEPVERWLWDIAKTADAKPVQMVRWIDDLKRICELLSASPDVRHLVDTAALFWVRIAGLFDEAEKHFEVRPELLEASTGREAERFLKARSDAAQAIRSLRSEFDEDEHRYIEFVRHNQCHIFQNGFSLKISGDSEKGYKVKDRYKDVPIEEIRKSIAGQLKKHGHDAFAAAAFSLRALPYLNQLAALARVGTELA